VRWKIEGHGMAWGAHDDLMMTGGGVAAGVLAVAGLDVVVLEKGPHWKEQDFASFTEADSIAKAYEAKGL